MTADPEYYVTADAARIADALIASIDQRDPAEWDMLVRAVTRTPAIAGWRGDADVPRFGAEEHLEAGWS